MLWTPWFDIYPIIYLHKGKIESEKCGTQSMNMKLLPPFLTHVLRSFDFDVIHDLRALEAMRVTDPYLNIEL